MAAIDPLDGIPTEGASIIRAGITRPELHVLKGDTIIAQPVQGDVPHGTLVVATNADGLADLVVWAGDASLTVIGRVVGLTRRFPVPGCAEHGRADCEPCFFEFVEGRHDES